MNLLDKFIRKCRTDGIVSTIRQSGRLLLRSLPTAKNQNSRALRQYIDDLRQSHRATRPESNQGYTLIERIDTQDSNGILFPLDSDFLSDLVLQRTGPFTKIGGENAINEWFRSGSKKQICEFLSQKDTADLYLMGVLNEITTELKSLTQELAKIDRRNFLSAVTIGPGNGLLELLLLKSGVVNKILLIDIEHTDIHKHNFADKGSGYASLRKTKEFMVINGLDEDLISICNPQKQALPQFKFDMLFSFISMGFHYPCNEYVDFILENANNMALVVLDKRRGAEDSGFEQLRRQAEIRTTIAGPKSDRFFLELTKSL